LLIHGVCSFQFVLDLQRCSFFVSFVLFVIGPESTSQKSECWALEARVQGPPFEQRDLALVLIGFGDCLEDLQSAA
jgi:hypothetical protein